MKREMKLENQVISLPIAKRLKELGVRQESIFSWYRNVPVEPESWGIASERDAEKIKKEMPGYIIEESSRISAFTVAELGEMLPESFLKEIKGLVVGDRYHLNIWKTGSNWSVYYEAEVGYMKFKKLKSSYTEPSEADARGKMLIYLIENGLIKL